MDTIGGYRKVLLLDLDFDDISLGEAAFLLLSRPAGAPFAYVVTPNADHLQRLHATPSLRPCYEAAWLCLLDSRVIARLAARLGLVAPAVVTGADLVATLLPRLSGRRVAVVGMTAAAMRELALRYPGIDFLHHEPPMRLATDEAALARAQRFIEATAADFTCLACGAPAQELLAHRVATGGRATGTGLCIGAALEFCAGTRARAPRWMRRRGLEWAWRLACEPRRLAVRYLLRDPPVLLRLIASSLRRT